VLRLIVRLRAGRGRRSGLPPVDAGTAIVSGAPLADPTFGGSADSGDDLASRLSPILSAPALDAAAPLDTATAVRGRLRRRRGRQPPDRAAYERERSAERDAEDEPEAAASHEAESRSDGPHHVPSNLRPAPSATSRPPRSAGAQPGEPRRHGTKQRGIPEIVRDVL
jgi:hypothetical protein